MKITDTFTCGVIEVRWDYEPPYTINGHTVFSAKISSMSGLELLPTDAIQNSLHNLIVVAPSPFGGLHRIASTETFCTYGQSVGAKLGIWLEPLKESV